MLYKDKQPPREGDGSETNNVDKNDKQGKKKQQRKRKGDKAGNNSPDENLVVTMADVHVDGDIADGDLSTNDLIKFCHSE